MSQITFHGSLGCFTVQAIGYSKALGWLTPASSTSTSLWPPVLAGAPRNHAGLEGLEVRGLEKLGEEKRGADTLTVNLSLRILANSEVREAGHVADCSRPSDRPGGRPRSCFPRSFCKNPLELKRNQPAVQVPLSENFAKKPSTFLEINPQSNNTG